MESPGSRHANAALTALLASIVLTAPSWFQSIRDWASGLRLLPVAAIGPVLAALATTFLCIVAGCVWRARGARTSAALLGLPLFVPVAVGLVSAAFRYLNFQSSIDLARFSTTNLDTMWLERRGTLIARAVDEFDRQRLTGLIGAGTLAMAAAIFSSFDSIGGHAAGPRKSFASVITPWGTAAAALSVWLYVHHQDRGWPDRFDYLGVLAFAVALALSVATSGTRPIADASRALIGLVLAGAVASFELAEAGVQRDRFLDAVPSDVPFPAGRIDIGAIPHDRAWLAALNALLVLVMFAVPSMRGKPERRAAWRAWVTGTIALAGAMLAVLAFDARVERDIVRYFRPFSRFWRVEGLTLPAGFGDASVFGPALFIPSTGGLLYDADAGAAPPVAVTGPLTSPDSMLVAADRRLTLAALRSALEPIRRGPRLEVKLVLAPHASARTPKLGDLTDILAGELRARPMVLFDSLAVESARGDDAARGLWRLGVLLDHESARCFSFDTGQSRTVPLGRTAEDRARRTVTLREASSDRQALTMVVAPLDDQPLDDILGAVTVLEESLNEARPGRQERVALGLSMTLDRSGLESASTRGAVRVPEPRLRASLDPGSISVQGPLSQERVLSSLLLAPSFVRPCIARSAEQEPLLRPQDVRVTILVEAFGNGSTSVKVGKSSGSRTFDSCIERELKERLRWPAASPATTVSATLTFLASGE